MRSRGGRWEAVLFAREVQASLGEYRLAINNPANACCNLRPLVRSSLRAQPSAVLEESCFADWQCNSRHRRVWRRVLGILVRSTVDSRWKHPFRRSPRRRWLLFARAGNAYLTARSGDRIGPMSGVRDLLVSQRSVGTQDDSRSMPCCRRQSATLADRILILNRRVTLRRGVRKRCAMQNEAVDRPLRPLGNRVGDRG
ncbi:hypothetical protein EC9_43040 [Rosistilla ulvae]|uniref:Uncharacterized protein n=1 Tax=Rosistilla ulvae TaxID=1930277 RepID=A0A517M5F4_9BACT|nr:hypothetical protein EC9_43040 [Rosistilla ulvae]